MYDQSKKVSARIFILLLEINSYYYWKLFTICVVNYLWKQIFSVYRFFFIIIYRHENKVQYSLFYSLYSFITPNCLLFSFITPNCLLFSFKRAYVRNSQTTNWETALDASTAIDSFLREILFRPITRLPAPVTPFLIHFETLSENRR